MARPSTYDPSYPDQLIDLMTKGYLDIQVYAKWKISKATFYRWLNEFPELQEAHDVGMVACEACYITKAQDAMDRGDDKGFKYYISIMNNKFGWEKGSKGDGTTNNIQIGNINVLQNKTRDGLLDYIRGSLEKHKDVLEVAFVTEKTNESE